MCGMPAQLDKVATEKKALGGGGHRCGCPPHLHCPIPMGQKGANGLNPQVTGKQAVEVNPEQGPWRGTWGEGQTPGTKVREKQGLKYGGGISHQDRVGWD